LCIMMISEQVFDVLHRNLMTCRPEHEPKQTIICPICLREISRSEVLVGGVEHIVPNVIVKSDPVALAGEMTKNQRSGLTVLCRRPRVYGDDKRLAKHGCNGLKGSLYDWSLKHIGSSTRRGSIPFTHRQLVGILIMGYLGAFQTFGYEYILRDELSEIRRQFDYPEITRTDWIHHINIFDSFHGVFTTENGMPFMVGGSTHPDAPLVVIFRKFSASLPGLGQQKNFTKDLPALRAI